MTDFTGHEVLIILNDNMVLEGLCTKQKDDMFRIKPDKSKYEMEDEIVLRLDDFFYIDYKDKYV